MPAPLVTFIIVTFNSAATIEPCLQSITSMTACAHEIVVVDNSPGPDTFQMIECFRSEHPQVKLLVIRPAENLGFGRACNLGARQSNGQYLFFLNPDTRLMNDASALLLECLEQRSGAVLVGPAVYDMNGRVTKTCRNLPNILRIVLDATGLDSVLGAYKLARFAHKAPRAVEQVIGAAMLMRWCDYERIGEMDERFFMYFEEVDLCKRLRDVGREIWFWPDAAVEHFAGHSCENNEARARMIVALRESRRKYFEKHFGPRSSALLELVNRLEALEKVIVLSALWVLRHKRRDREKINGFWAVAVGNAMRF